MDISLFGWYNAVAYALTQLVQNLTERSGGNGAVAVFAACYDGFCTVYASGIQAASVTPWVDV